MDVLVNFSFNNEVKLVKVTSQSKNLPSFGNFVEKVREKFNITNCIGFTNVYGAALEDDIFEAYVQKYSSHPDFIIFVKIQDESIATSDSPKELISTGKIVEVSSREFESHVSSASFPVEYKKEIQKPEKTSVLRKVAQIDDNLEMWMEDTKTKDSSHDDNSRESICGSISERKDLANEEESVGEGDHDETGDLVLENYSGGMANGGESVGEGDHDETGDLVLENYSDGMANEGVPMEDTDHNGGLQQQEKTIKKSNRKITLKELKAHFLFIEGEEFFQTATGKFLNLARKRKIVAIAVNFIKRKFGTFLPDRDMKVHVSQLIHKLFPEIDHKTLYNPTTKKGLLETKCRYLRRREMATTGKKKQQKRTQNPPALPTEPANEQEARKRIAFLRHASVKEQKPEMITMFKENYHHRRQNLATLVEDYGNILKLLPELITYDYEVEHGSVDILAWFQKNGSKIEKFHDELTSGRKKQIKQVADEWSDPNIQMVLKLHGLFPPVNTDKTGQKKGLKECLDQFVCFCPLNSTPAEVTQNVEKITDQPQLVAEGSNKKAISNYYIKVDHCLWGRTNNFITAFEAFYKIHFVLNIQYKKESYNFLTFVQKEIYKCDINTNSKSTTVEYYRNLFS